MCCAIFIHFLCKLNVYFNTSFATYMLVNNCFIEIIKSWWGLKTNRNKYDYGKWTNNYNDYVF